MKEIPDMHLSGIFVAANKFHIFLTYISLFGSFCTSDVRDVPVFFKER